MTAQDILSNVPTTTESSMDLSWAIPIAVTAAIGLATLLVHFERGRRERLDGRRMWVALEASRHGTEVTLTARVVNPGTIRVKLAGWSVRRMRTTGGCGEPIEVDEPKIRFTLSHGQTTSVQVEPRDCILLTGNVSADWVAKRLVRDGEEADSHIYTVEDRRQFEEQKSSHPTSGFMAALEGPPYMHIWLAVKNGLGEEYTSNKVVIPPLRTASWSDSPRG
jgi:hypothetical protein